MVLEAFAVGQGLQTDIVAQARAQNAFAGRRRQIMTIAAAGVIAMGMGDDRAFHRSPRIDVEITGRTVKTFGTGNDQIHEIPLEHCWNLERRGED